MSQLHAALWGASWVLGSAVLAGGVAVAALLDRARRDDGDDWAEWAVEMWGPGTALLGEVSG